MSHTLHAAYYADQAAQRAARVLENAPVARDTFRLRLACPEIAARITPGQFVMVRVADDADPLIGRPLALYDTVLDARGEPVALDVVYLVKGKFTRALARKPPGQTVEIWGPLGNGFAPRVAPHVALVAGGIGQTPFLATAQELLGSRTYGPTPRAARAERVTLCYGARAAAYLAGVEDFERAGARVRVCTDDGSRGQRGLVTDALRELLDAETPPPVVLCCGPEPMMRAVSELAAARGAACEVSLETPMACGVGICFTCVAKIRDDTGGWDYKRTCVEGPVFAADRVVWD